LGSLAGVSTLAWECDDNDMRVKPRKGPHARKNDGLDVTDRIVLRWSAIDAEVSAALSEHAALIAGEVLAVEYGPGEPVAGMREHADPELGLRFWLSRA